MLRGINVGGNNKLPMRDLVSLLEGLGLQNVKTYIQSGKFVFQSKQADSAQLSQAITGANRQSHGFTPCITARNWRTVNEVMAIAAAVGS